MTGYPLASPGAPALFSSPAATRYRTASAMLSAAAGAALGLQGTGKAGAGMHHIDWAGAVPADCAPLLVCSALWCVVC